MDRNRRAVSRRDVIKGAAIGAACCILNDMSIASIARGAAAIPTNGALPRATPASLGVDPAAITAFIRTVNDKVGGLHSFMLLRHEKVAAEGWWEPYAPEHPQTLFSLSKSFTSTAVGMAVAEGRLTVEDKVVSFFPDKLPETLSDHLAAMRVKDLLTMSTGHEKEPDVGRQPDWVKAFLAAPVDHAPGTHFLYNTAATHVLSAIVQKLTGQRLLAYLGPRLFEPLGIEGATWEQSPAGIDIGGYGLSVKTEDIARFGQLYLQKGNWNGKQLIPESWVAEATSKQVSNGDPATGADWNQGYGYQFWRSKHDNYRGDGAFGQFCIVMRRHDAVLAITSGVSNMGAVMNAAWDHLLPGMGTLDAAADPASEAALRTLLDGLAVPAPAGTPSSETASRVSGRTYAIDANDDMIESVTFAFDGPRGTVRLRDTKGERAMVFGHDEWVRGEVRDDDGPVDKVAGRGAWTERDTYEMRLCFYETPFVQTMVCRFEGDGVTISRKVNVSFGNTDHGTLRGKAT
jgi:CubicO group peptidase (beta-lactamase class C family)